MGRVIYPDGLSCESDQISGSVLYQLILDAIRDENYKPDYRAKCILFISKLNTTFTGPIMPYLRDLSEISDLTLRTAARRAIRDISRQENMKAREVDKVQFMD